MRYESTDDAEATYRDVGSYEHTDVQGTSPGKDEVESRLER